MEAIHVALALFILLSLASLMSTMAIVGRLVKFLQTDKELQRAAEETRAASSSALFERLLDSVQSSNRDLFETFKAGSLEEKIGADHLRSAYRLEEAVNAREYAKLAELRERDPPKPQTLTVIGMDGTEREVPRSNLEPIGFDELTNKEVDDFFFQFETRASGPKTRGIS